MPEASCPGCEQKIVYVPAERFTSNSFWSPTETSSLVATVLPELSRIARSCWVVPELTSQKTALPLDTLRLEGANLNSVIVTMVEPAG